MFFLENVYQLMHLKWLCKKIAQHRVLHREGKIRRFDPYYNTGDITKICCLYSQLHGPGVCYILDLLTAGIRRWKVNRARKQIINTSLRVLILVKY